MLSRCRWRRAQVEGLTNGTNLLTKDLSSRLTGAAVCGAFDLHLSWSRLLASGKRIRVGSLSPAVDAGDPQSPYDREPQTNGDRINLGNYGNTPEATLSKAGTMLRVR